MVGFIQIMIYLLCVYLIYKGVEIFQLALVSPKEGPSRPAGIAIGILAIIIAAFVVVGALWMTEDMAARMSDNMNRMPTFP